MQGKPPPQAPTLAGAKAPASCPHMSGCEMFSILTYAGTLGAWKARYCTGDYGACARFQTARQGKPVPINLMPNGALLRKQGT